MSAKTVNYTAEQTSAIVEGYKAGRAISELAAQVGRSERSVVAKLSREGAYVSKAKTVAGKAGETKEQLIAKLAEKVGVEAEQLESLEKATKSALKALIAYASK